MNKYCCLLRSDGPSCFQIFFFLQMKCSLKSLRINAQYLWWYSITFSSLTILQVCSSIDVLSNGWRLIQHGIHSLLRNAENVICINSGCIEEGLEVFCPSAEDFLQLVSDHLNSVVSCEPGKQNHMQHLVFRRIS